MQALLAFSTSAHEWAGSPPASRAGELAQTLYSIGIVVCLALLVLWWGLVRPRR
jgi:uncharacterized protein (TIGR03382 family)